MNIWSLVCFSAIWIICSTKTEASSELCEVIKVKNLRTVSWSFNLIFSLFLLKGYVPDIKADLGPVLHGDAVSAEKLELLDLPVGRIHLPTVHIARVENWI